MQLSVTKLLNLELCLQLTGTLDVPVIYKLWIWQVMRKFNKNEDTFELKNWLFQQLQLPSSERYKTEWKHIFFLYHTGDGNCNCWNVSVFKLISVVIFVKLVINLLSLRSFMRKWIKSPISPHFLQSASIFWALCWQIWNKHLKSTTTKTEIEKLLLLATRKQTWNLICC